ncbi:MAG: M12 family metallo-peptidase [Bdellovibrionota bacterium]
MNMGETLKNGLMVIGVLTLVACSQSTPKTSESRASTPSSSVTIPDIESLPPSTTDDVLPPEEALDPSSATQPTQDPAALTRENLPTATISSQPQNAPAIEAITIPVVLLIDHADRKQWEDETKDLFSQVIERTNEVYQPFSRFRYKIERETYVNFESRPQQKSNTSLAELRLEEMSNLAPTKENPDKKFVALSFAVDTKSTTRSIAKVLSNRISLLIPIFPGRNCELDALAHIFLHELGHSNGLQHEYDPDSLMWVYGKNTCNYKTYSDTSIQLLKILENNHPMQTKGGVIYLKKEIGTRMVTELEKLEKVNLDPLMLSSTYLMLARLSEVAFADKTERCNYIKKTDQFNVDLFEKIQSETSMSNPELLTLQNEVYNTFLELQTLLSSAECKDIFSPHTYTRTDNGVVTLDNPS